MVVRCTRRMLDLLGDRAGALAELPPAVDDWYLNLLWIERRKCLLLAHAGTLFSVFLADVRAAELRPPGPYLVRAIETALRSEHLPADTFGQLDPDRVLLAKTASRSTLGFMNDMAFQLRHQIASARGLNHSDTSILNQQLRRTPYDRDGYHYPIDLAAQRLGARA